MRLRKFRILKYNSKKVRMQRRKLMQWKRFGFWWCVSYIKRS